MLTFTPIYTYRPTPFYPSLHPPNFIFYPPTHPSPPPTFPQALKAHDRVEAVAHWGCNVVYVLSCWSPELRDLLGNAKVSRVRVRVRVVLELDERTFSSILSSTPAASRSTRNFKLKLILSITSQTLSQHLNTSHPSGLRGCLQRAVQARRRESLGGSVGLQGHRGPECDREQQGQVPPERDVQRRGGGAEGE